MWSGKCFICFVQKYVILWNLCCFHKLRDLWMGGTLRVLFIFLCCHKRNGWQRIVHYSLFFLFMSWGRKYRAWKKNCLFSLCQPWERLSAMESGRTFFFKHTCKSELALILLVLKKSLYHCFCPHGFFFPKELPGELTMFLRYTSISYSLLLQTELHQSASTG